MQEQKKLRTQRRQAREQEKQELMRQGLLEAPKPKVRISNLMRVLGAEATADPTAIEQEVRRQMAERQQAHEDRNLARKLTPAERREKKLAKLFSEGGGSASAGGEEAASTAHVAVYKVGSLAAPKNRFKVRRTRARRSWAAAPWRVVGGWAKICGRLSMSQRKR